MLDPETAARGARAAALVTNLTILTLGGALLGWQLDERFHTAPWLLLVGVLLGFALGLLALFRGLNLLQAQDDEEEPPDSP